MLGETEANWRDCIDRTLALEPDSVTIYQMELPYNTTISGDLLKGGGPVRRTGRRLGHQAALGAGGVRRARARRLPRRQRLHRGQESVAKTKFVYRDRLWEGADLLGLGVASFGHINGVHVQNLDKWPKYQAAIEDGDIPLGRAYRPTDEERLIREFVLQLKRGSNRPVVLRSRNTASTSCRALPAPLTPSRRRVSRRGERRSYRPDARRADARRRAAAPLLPA